jgi:hypothetical protein
MEFPLIKRKTLEKKGRQNENGKGSLSRMRARDRKRKEE